MQPQSLSPDRAILSNVIRQGEKVRVGEKGGGFMLVIERTSISHRPFKGLCPTGAVPSRNCREATGSALLSGRWEREFQGSMPPDFCWTVPEYSRGGGWCKERGCLQQHDYVR